MTKKKVSESLAAIGIRKDEDYAALKECATFQDEFKLVRKAYLKRCLATHPDKGGDEQDFRRVNESFEFLKRIYETGKAKSFTTATSRSVGHRHDADDDDDDDDDADADYEEEEEEFDFDFDANFNFHPSSYEYYEQAAQQDLPSYRMEYAKSGRGKCFATRTSKTCGPVDAKCCIAKGSVRIGSLDAVAGTYTRWSHLECWRIPSKVWLGLPDPDSEDDPQAFIDALHQMDKLCISGFSDLEEEDQLAVVEFVREKAHWAKLVNTKTKENIKSKSKTKSTKQSSTTQTAPKPEPTISATAGNEEDTDNKKPAAIPSNSGMDTKTTTSSTGSSTMPDQSYSSAAVAVAASTLTALVSSSSSRHVTEIKQRFIIPIPGRSGIPQVLNGHTIVLTGTFPEVGGGSGLNQGKDKVKSMLQSFGAKVTGSVSGRTTILCVGKDPGMSKVSKAKKQPKCQSMNLRSIRNLLVGENTLEEATSAPLKIASFSKGYYGNGLSLLASEEDLNELRKPNTKKRPPPPVAIEAAADDDPNINHAAPPPAKKKKVKAKKTAVKSTANKVPTTVPALAAKKAKAKKIATKSTANKVPTAVPAPATKKKKKDIGKKNGKAPTTKRKAPAIATTNKKTNKKQIAAKKTAKPPVPVAATTGDINTCSSSPSSDDYYKRTVKELKDILRSKNLGLGGKKADLVARIVKHDDESNTTTVTITEE